MRERSPRSCTTRPSAIGRRCRPTGTVSGVAGVHRQGLALPQARRRHGMRDREDRRAAEPRDLVARGAPRAGPASRPLVSWPRDDAKLDRVRALMAEHDLDALVVRAPDNVLYLTNFWGMKGYDACVLPREGEPVAHLSRGVGGGCGAHGLDERRAPVQGLRRGGSAPSDLARPRARE